MKKKMYETPQMEITEIEFHHAMLTGSDTTSDPSGNLPSTGNDNDFDFEIPSKNPF